MVAGAAGPRGNRLEDRRLVTGTGHFAADAMGAGVLHACFVRADRAHADILRIDATRALALAGVHGVWTGEDALRAGYTKFFQLLRLTGSDGRAIAKPARPVLAAGRVRHVGEALAMVVADTADIAADAASLVDVTWRDLPPVIGAARALAGGGVPDIHAEAPGNLAFAYEAGDRTAVEASFRQAVHVARVTVESTRVSAQPLEQRACRVEYDAASDRYELHLPIQGINTMRLQIAELTGVPGDRLLIRARDVGGSFGQRSQAYPEYAALMLAARALGRPVGWVATRSEACASDTHGRAIVGAARLALDAEGRFLAFAVDYTMDLGAWPTPGGPASHIRNPVACLTGVYRIPVAHAAIRMAFTNTVPVAAYRGAGRPDCTYVMERVVDQAAADLGIDPAELRRRNYVPREAFPYRTPSGTVYETCDFAALERRARELARYDDFAARRDDARRRGRLRGIGMATALEVSWPGMLPRDQIHVVLDAEGGITATTVVHSSGQGHETTFAKIIADGLGLALDRVRIRQAVNEVTLVGNHTGGSRSTAAVGSVCRLAVQQVIERARPLAAEALGVEPSQVAYAGGRYTVAGTDRELALTELAARRADAGAPALAFDVEGEFGSTYPNTCHIAEVEIDPDTGATEVVRYTVVDDSGTVVNPPVVEGQVHGAVVQGWGQVFGEHMAYDPDTGQLLSGSFLDYPMPRAGAVREILHDERPIPTAGNALGAKGVGEGGCVGALPALANAVLDALRASGVGHLDMPMTPARIWEALRAAGAATAARSSPP